VLFSKGGGKRRRRRRRRRRRKIHAPRPNPSNQNQKFVRKKKKKKKKKKTFLLLFFFFFFLGVFFFSFPTRASETMPPRKARKSTIDGHAAHAVDLDAPDYLDRLSILDEADEAASDSDASRSGADDDNAKAAAEALLPPPRRGSPIGDAPWYGFMISCFLIFTCPFYVYLRRVCVMASKKKKQRAKEKSSKKI
jgi:hypothetical protein